ncbi:hypothetical protein RintRC_6335 [Richelia intracellularis]|nr:hypothetical protein RintRC_6335 [Richelia intracellularis]
MLLDQELIADFIKCSLNRREVLLSNYMLRAETAYDTNQLIAKKEGIIMKAERGNINPIFYVKGNSSYWQLVNETLANYSFILSGEKDKLEFYPFHYYQIPKGYKLMCTRSVVLWQMWWKYKKHIRSRAIPLEFLIRNRNVWYPVRDLIISQGFIYIRTLGTELDITQDDWITWLRKIDAN